jgi:transcriptional regulator with XRE-family HTH domain
MTTPARSATIVHVSATEADDGSFSDYIEELFALTGDSNATASRKTGLHHSLVSKWRLGETLPSIPRARQFADGMGVPRLVVMIRAGLLEPEDAQIDPLFIELAELERKARIIDADEQKTLRAHVRILIGGTRERLQELAKKKTKPSRRRAS